MKNASFLLSAWVVRLGLAGGLFVAGIGVGHLWTSVVPGAVDRTPSADTPSAEEPVVPDHVHLAKERWAGAGIQVEPAPYVPFRESHWRSGRLILNETRVSHLCPMVEGIVREVKVRLGEEVKQGQELVVLDSREVGQAKLELVKTRLAADYARAQHRWTQTVNKNAGELLEALAADTPIASLEKQFKDRPLGDLRQQLITAYSRRLQARAYVEAATTPEASGALSEATRIRLRAELEAAEASFHALREEVKFQTTQQVLVSAHKVREAETAEALSRTQLMMFGYTPTELDRLDPIAEGTRVSLYPLRAPFAGTVLDVHAVLAERVTSQSQMFKIADLSTLWLQVDVFDRDLTLSGSLKGSTLAFRISDEEKSSHKAEVFYTGDEIQPETRALAVMATVNNAARSLKPGLFVEVELGQPEQLSVQVPLQAIQREGTATYLFVHLGGDQFQRVRVQLGRSSGQMVEILSGLKAGQPVAVAGGFVLKSELLKDQIAGE